MSSPPVVFIQSKDNPWLQRLRKQLSQPGGYRQAGGVWLEGDHLCRAVRQRQWQVAQALITERAWQERPEWRELAQHAQRVAVLPEALMAGLSGLESPAALGFWVALDQMGPPLAPGEALRLRGDAVVLDRLQDPGNVGSVLRSAAALGAGQVVALKGTVALWSPKVLRAGMGAHFGLELHEGLEPSEVLAWGWPLVATSSHRSTPLPQAALPSPCAWVLGHEGQGVCAPLMDAATARVGIPQPGGEESLNVAAAAAICLYEGVRRRAQ